MTQQACGRLLERWMREGRVQRAGETRWLTQQAFEEARNSVLGRMQDLQAGTGGRSQFKAADLRRSELKDQSGLQSEVFDHVFKALEREEALQIVGEFVMRPASSTIADPHHDLLASIANKYEEAGLAPPYPDDLATQLGITPAEMRRSRHAAAAHQNARSSHQRFAVHASTRARRSC